MIQPQEIDKNEEGAITLDDNRTDFFKQLEKECEEIRREMENQKEVSENG